jgi:hypothetical protein
MTTTAHTTVWQLPPDLASPSRGWPRRPRAAVARRRRPGQRPIWTVCPCRPLQNSLLRSPQSLVVGFLTRPGDSGNQFVSLGCAGSVA